MSNQNHSLFNAGAGETGEAVQVSNACSVSITASTWGGESVTLQAYNSRADQWVGIADATFTANANQTLRLGMGEKVRAVTSGSGGTMAGVKVYFVNHAA